MPVLLLAGLLMFGGVVQSSPPDNARAVEAFVAAFNARDVDAMLALATDDIAWLSIDGTAVSVETSGKAALAESLRKYFASCPTCRSEVVIGAQTTARVAAVETATWTAASGPRSQRSLSIYEFVEGRIRRVFYYPAER
jgi:hypothetical protein